ncbi:DNA topoisomerase 2 [Massospora cicadina]|nr:DNA topoisomerase 2 [Massospora cicadina]
MEDWHLNFGIIEDYEKHHSNLGIRCIIWVSEASMAKLEKEDLYAKFKLTDSISTSNLVCFDKSSHITYTSAEEILIKFYDICLQFYHKCKEDLVSKLIYEYTKIYNQARFILAFKNEELEMHNVTHNNLIKQLIEIAFDPINAKDDDVATFSSFKYLLDIKIISMDHETVEKLIIVCNKKFKEIEESKETKPKGLSCFNNFRPAVVKPESPSHAKVKLGSPLLVKPFSYSSRTLKLKSKPIQDDSKDSDDQFKGSFIQRTEKKLPSAIKLFPKSKSKATLKCKNPKVSNSKEDFEVEATLPTITEACLHHQAVPKASYANTIGLLSEEEEPSEAEMELFLEFSM